MTITLSQAQGAFTMALLSDAIRVLDERIEAIVESDDHNQAQEDELPDLMEEHEQASRLHDLILGQVREGATLIWECPQSFCAWLNLMSEEACEQCSTPRAKESDTHREGASVSGSHS